MPRRDYHLEQPDRQVAETKQLIARQRELIAALDFTNQPSATAQSMLEALEKSLEAFERHRRLIPELYSTMPPLRDGSDARRPNGRKRLDEVIGVPSMAAE